MPVILLIAMCGITLVWGDAPAIVDFGCLLIVMVGSYAIGTTAD